jgi:lipopolysaccharide export system protein LptA
MPAMQSRTSGSVCLRGAALPTTAAARAQGEAYAFRGWVTSDEVRVVTDEVRVQSDEVRVQSDEVRVQSDEVRVQSDEVRVQSDEDRVQSDEVCSSTTSSTT